MFWDRRIEGKYGVLCFVPGCLVVVFVSEVSLPPRRIVPVAPEDPSLKIKRATLPVGDLTNLWSTAMDVANQVDQDEFLVRLNLESKAGVTRTISELHGFLLLRS